MKTLTAARSGALLAGAALLLAGCSSPSGSSSSSSSASSEKALSGSLTVACSQQEDFCEAITSAFAAETGVDTSYVTLGAGQVIARMQAAGADTPEFDVWAGGQAENHLLAADQGFIEDYVSENADDLDEKFADPEGTWAGFYTDSLGFCSNTAVLDELGLEAPTSWDDLLDPALAQQVVLPSPSAVGTGYMAVWTQQTLDGLDDDATVAYFTALDENILQYTDTAAAGGLMAGQGEVAVAIGIDADCSKYISSGYSDLTLTYPEEGTGYEIGAVSLVKNATNTENAKAFYDWLLTTDAQNLYPEIPSLTAPTNPDATLGDDTPDQSSVPQVDWDVASSSSEKTRLLELLTAQVPGIN